MRIAQVAVVVALVGHQVVVQGGHHAHHRRRSLRVHLGVFTLYEPGHARGALLDGGQKRPVPTDERAVLLHEPGDARVRGGGRRRHGRRRWSVLTLLGGLGGNNHSSSGSVVENACPAQHRLRRPQSSAKSTFRIRRAPNVCIYRAHIARAARGRTRPRAIPHGTCSPCVIPSEKIRHGHQDSGRHRRGLRRVVRG